MGVIENFETVCTLAEAQVAAAGASRNAPTPNSEFDVETLVSHMICALKGTTAMIDGRQPPSDPGNPPDLGDADLASAFKEAAAETIAAFRADGALSRSVPGPTGEDVTGEMLLHFPLFDTYVHTWDLAQATGHPTEFPGELTDYVRNWSETIFAQGRPPVVGDPVDPPAGATSMDELAAFTGRSALR